jgi:hypothetical protein
MIQRKQTLFMLLAFICTVVCLCLPVGSFTPQGMGADMSMYNLWVVEPNGAHNFAVWALFAILLVTLPICIAAIFSYHNRKGQARFCLFNVLLCLGWYVVYVVFSQVLAYGDFHPSFAAVLPLVSMILYVMARKAILADEALVRAADRIR